MASQYVDLPTTTGTSTSGQLLFNNAGIITGVNGSLVRPSTDLSNGSVALTLPLVVGNGTPLSVLGSYKFAVYGPMFAKNSAGTAFWADFGVNDIYKLGDLSNFAHGSKLFIDTSGDASLHGGNAGLLLLTASDGTAYLGNQLSGSYMIADSTGGVTIRATGDLGGVYADSTGNTYVGSYSNNATLVVDSGGNVSIGNGNGAPFGHILQVGPDTAPSGATFLFNGANNGNQVFFDIMSGFYFNSCSIRVFTDIQCGEFAAIANAGEYFTNSQPGDTALKGAPSGGNRFLIGVGSFDSQVLIDSTGLQLSNLTAGQVLLAGTNGLITDNAGLTYVSGSGLKLNTVGEGVYYKEGTNARMGTATMVAGAVTVSTSRVTASSRIFLTTQTPGGTLGAVYVNTRTAGTSFQIKSTSATDTSTVAWIIVEPA